MTAPPTEPSGLPPANPRPIVVNAKSGQRWTGIVLERYDAPAPPAGYPPLPPTARSRHGYVVDLGVEPWVLPRSAASDSECSVPVHRLDAPPDGGTHGIHSPPPRDSLLSPGLAYAARLYAAARLPQIAPHSVTNIVSEILRFERWLLAHGGGIAPRGFGSAQLTYEVFRDYARWSIDHFASRGSGPSRIRLFYGWCVRRSLPGFDRRTADRMRGLPLPESLKGHLTRMRHPQKGALTWDEQVQIDQRIREGAGRTGDRAIVALFAELGVRAEAAVAIRGRHLEPPSAATGGRFYLSVPRVKQRTAVSLDEVTRWKITDRLGALLLAAAPAGGHAPEAPLLWWLGRYPHHSIGHAVKRWADETDLLTTRVPREREGYRSRRRAAWLRRQGVPEPTLARLPLFPYRFRRTVATNLAELGATAEQVMVALDDRTLGMAVVYVENTSAIVDVLEETLDRHPDWVSLVRLFQGRVADAADRATLPVVLGGAPDLEDYDEYADIGPLFRCALLGDCDEDPPLACYTCPFARAEPSVEAHERQIAQMQREIDRKTGVESDRVAATLRRPLNAAVQLVHHLAKDREGGMQAVVERLRQSRIRRVARDQLRAPGRPDAPAGLGAPGRVAP